MNAEQLTVYVHADDPILRAGLASQLRPRSEVKVIDAPEPGRTSVALVVADRVAEPTLRTLRSLQRVGARLVLVVAELDDLADVVDVDAVSAQWRGDEPMANSFLLLQGCWLALEAD